MLKLKHQLEQPPPSSTLKELEDLRIKINELEVTIEEYQQKQK